MLVANPLCWFCRDTAHIIKGDVWKPDVALRNSVKQFKELGVTTLNVKVDMDGWVEWYPFEVSNLCKDELIMMYI
jgi:hypothetical protein